MPTGPEDFAWVARPSRFDAVLLPFPPSLADLDLGCTAVRCALTHTPRAATSRGRASRLSTVLDGWTGLAAIHREQLFVDFFGEAFVVDRWAGVDADGAERFKDPHEDGCSDPGARLRRLAAYFSLLAAVRGSAGQAAQTQ